MTSNSAGHRVTHPIFAHAGANQHPKRREGASPFARCSASIANTARSQAVAVAAGTDFSLVVTDGGLVYSCGDDMFVSV
jgi:hypothetical protein